MLTEEQRKTVESESPTVSVIAGAGTGKTSTIIARIKHLIAEGVSPDSIALFTFTRAAATEIQCRLQDTSGSGILAGTFHSIAYDLMPNPKPVVLREQQMETVLKAGSYYSDKIKNLSQAKKAWSMNRCAGHQAMAGYVNSVMRMHNTIDYDGLIMWLDENIAALNQIKHVLIDESQDTDPAQWKIIDKLVTNGAKLFAVGDPRQCIYEWRGAHWDDWLKRAGETRGLTRTFRFPQDVAEFANKLADAADIGSNHPLVSSKMVTHEPCITATHNSIADIVNELIEDELFATNEIAVLCKTNRAVGSAIDQLNQVNIPVDQAGKEALPLVLPFIEYLANPNSYTLGTLVAQDETWNTLVRWHALDLKMVSETLHKTVVCVTISTAIGFITRFVEEGREPFNSEGDLLSECRQWLERYGDWPLKDAAADQAFSLGVTPLSDRSGVLVCTIHQSKGLEFPAVVLNVDPGYYRVTLNSADYRLLHVGVTRCKDRLIVTSAGRDAADFQCIEWMLP